MIHKTEEKTPQEETLCQEETEQDQQDKGRAAEEVRDLAVKTSSPRTKAGARGSPCGPGLADVFGATARARHPARAVAVAAVAEWAGEYKRQLISKKYGERLCPGEMEQDPRDWDHGPDAGLDTAPALINRDFQPVQALAAVSPVAAEWGLESAGDSGAVDGLAHGLQPLSRLHPSLLNRKRPCSRTKPKISRQP